MSTLYSLIKKWIISLLKIIVSHTKFKQTVINKHMNQTIVIIHMFEIKNMKINFLDIVI